jgi:spore coat protein A
MTTRRRVVLGLPQAFWGWSQDSPRARALEEYGRVRAATFSRPMPIPPRRAAGDTLELAIGRGTTQVLPGAPTEIWGYAGAWPGPTIVATRGRPLRLRVRNQLDENMSVHNHGLTTAAHSDGHPVDYIHPGAIKEYVYPNDQPGGTFWLHDHALGLTGAHVYRGLAAFYLLEDPDQAALGLPAAERDVPILIQDRRFDERNALVYAVDAGAITTGFLGNALCVNGVHTPFLEVAACRYRFRFLNGCNARNLCLSLGERPLVQIASDGSLLAAPLPRASVELAPAERCDCIVDFSHFAPGSRVVLRNLDPTWPVLPEVMRFHVTGRASERSAIPARLATVGRLDETTARVRRRIRFQLSDGKWTMNGLRFDPARIDFRPRLGSVEVWELHNAEATQMHPFHQHLIPFQVLEVNGRPPPPELLGWKDTVAVPPHGMVRVIMRFTHFRGIYVFHCHKLEHEDHAMMLQQEVV